MDAAALSISVAGIVLKLVIFSLDFVGDAKQVYKHGATDRNVDLSTVTKSVEDATTSLVKQLDSLSGNQVLDKDDEQLKELSLHAAEIGQELAQRLRRVTADDKSKWKSFKAATLGMWDAGEIEKTEKRLNAIKDQVQLRILVGIREKVDRCHDTDNSRMLSTLEEVAKQQAGSKDDTKRMIEKLNTADEVGRGRHEELVQLGNQLLNSINAISISGSSIPAPLSQAPSGVHGEAAREEAKRCILNSLWYPSIHSREETISETYANTFQWIFEDPETAGKPWDSFVDFLKGDTSTYWITGKPGCGKSTLMKFISDSPKTQALLEQWVGNRDLIKASYYFYYNGGDNQKSEIGLIRSLLYSILASRRDLIPTTFKTRYQDAIEGRKSDDLSLPEARRALRDLINHNSNLCLFILIDGLDEFDPVISRTRVQSLIDLTHSFDEFKNVKLLISSRPLPEFELGYDGSPSLSVHHLTQDDIRRYANEKLMNHPRMKILTKKDPWRTRDLLHSVVELSLGVFLWVRLVTESLAEGLTNGDNIGDLKARLNDHPSDLQDLYRTMLYRIDPRYKAQTSRLLSFVHSMTSKYEELALLDLWFAENAEDDMVHNTPVKPIEIEEIRDRVQEVQTLFKSRCLGLIESVPSKEKPAAGHVSYTPVIYDFSINELTATARFIHRSVYEFLNREDVWSEVVKEHLNPTFSATLSLFRSIVLIIKTYRQPSEDIWQRIMNLATIAGQRAKLAELETKQPHSNLLHELDLAMRGVMPLVYRCPETWRDLWPTKAYGLDHNCHWSAWCRSWWASLPPRHAKVTDWPVIDNAHGSLMSFAVGYGLNHYIESQIASEGRKVLDKKGLPLLGYALMNARFHSAETIKCLLDKGCNPNELYNGVTIWEWYLWNTSSFCSPEFIILSNISTMEELLLAGANPDAQVLCKSQTEDPFQKFDSWGLSWRPKSVNGATVCTILLAFTRLRHNTKGEEYHTYCNKENCTCHAPETIERIIRYLEECGAVKEEWTDEDSVRRICVEICQRIDSTVSSSRSAPYEGRRWRWYKKVGRRLKCYMRR
ncbi:hypothetical protein CHU98_g7397 [Xylaria longipes]|nr:hypothetical protein CHU98_g7397 [Xylaria longipes]